MAKALRRFWAVGLLCAFSAAAQSQPPSQPQGQQTQPQQQQPDQQAPQQQAPRPTLGPPPDQPSQPNQPNPPNRPTLGAAPSLGGPHAPNTNDAAHLLRVHSIYIEPMDNGLADKLIQDIGNKGVFRIVTDRRDADAVLHGTCFDAAHLKTVHSEVFLLGRNGAAIWQDIVRQPYKPPPLAQAVGTTAQAIADDLVQSVREAHQR
jgi:hemolysin activation/secretion protein